MSDQREQNLASLRSDAAFDVVVIGGGVNGIGVYRDLSLQGLRVLLVERNDFCSGCSAAPSRMIHGGLRYLENGEFDLVRESLRERDALLENAPHLVRPLPTMIPITSRFSGMLNAAASFVGWKGKPASRGAVPIKLGLSLYDWVTRTRRVLPRHRFNSAAQTRQAWPDLTPNATRSAVYHDAWISHPERLCIEMLRDTARANRASVALNYTELDLRDGTYHVRDVRTGVALPVRPKVIVNATGAWLDDTIRTLGNGLDKPLVSGTKGSHLIIDNPDLLKALGGHMVYFENTDGRVCIVFPYLGKVLAGSTDIRVERARRVRCEDEERDYILGSLRLVFPDLTFSSDDVVFSYSGIRPLPHSEHDFTGRISRGHYTKRMDGLVPHFCMIGGKWTTFRAFAEQTADEVLAELGKSRRQSTFGSAIGGGVKFPSQPSLLEEELVRHHQLSAERAAHLTAHYGTQARQVAEACRAVTDTPLAPGCPYTHAEICLLLREEYIQTLSDVVLRRTLLAITGGISMQVIDTLADLLKQERNLSEQDLNHQRKVLINELAEFHGVSAETLIARNIKRSEECVLAAKPA
ncbi:glycerol-3-phosphate dehydrogenase/oxidase [Ruegeria atlantica]|uniref:glycerol-3-phosphate dehydrogenase/oxidase n=1 Tax=Ruegeria atlantica TaxID=81569 RepID=UPI0014808F8F|nr:glycerol-3-phosphate dehydrogenase/oxidase [Ruegeria atlantica]